ncbi:hypothetical protein [Halarchaeum sp. P4]|uniref:hypothetical protein n=1 Tax=Halarchaeum sp. P4 TaxID=3421639 RepID=UPI003EB71719
MSLASALTRTVAAAVVWCSLLAVAAALTLGGFFGVRPGPYGGAALVAACLLVAILAGYVAATGIPRRAASNGA